MNRLSELEAFVVVSQSGGFTDAAEKTGIAKSVLSRRVSDLEKRLGVQLIQRTTRRQALTELGTGFLQRAEQILADLDEAEQSTSSEQMDLSGRIRVTIPLVLGVNRLAQPIARFMKDFPQIKIDVDLNDRTVDLIDQGYDMAIRVGDLSDSNLLSRRIATVSFCFGASPAYLETRGWPKNPSELPDHEVMVYSNAPVGRAWYYMQDGKRITPKMNYRLSANNGDFLGAAATHGLALVSGPTAVLSPYFERGELVRLFEGFPRPEAGMYAIYPPGRLITNRVRRFSDYLAEDLNQQLI